MSTFGSVHPKAHRNVTTPTTHSSNRFAPLCDSFQLSANASPFTPSNITEERDEALEHVLQLKGGGLSSDELDTSDQEEVRASPGNPIPTRPSKQEQDQGNRTNPNRNWLIGIDPPSPENKIRKQMDPSFSNPAPLWKFPRRNPQNNIDDHPMIPINQYSRAMRVLPVTAVSPGGAQGCSWTPPSGSDITTPPPQANQNQSSVTTGTPH